MRWARQARRVTCDLFDLPCIIFQKFREQFPHVCRASVQQIEKGRIEEAEKKHHELTKQIASATLLQVEAMFESDMEKLKAKCLVRRKLQQNMP